MGNSVTYKRLENYIEEINIRNTDLKVEKLLGVSIQKKMMTSIANIIGTDMATYKIIKKGQFAYGPVTSRNGEKISIALLNEFEEAIISQAYTCFEVIDENKLLPEYLMMWFRRPEFDRYARFKSHGSAREIFDWTELCNIELPIPSIEMQCELVAEYNAVQKRIDLNNQLIQKLEETAQAIYKQWFVEFEFPNDDGKPYKSSGGEMVETELGEIPKEWRVGILSEIIEIKYGKAYSHLSFGNIPLYGSGGIMGYVSDFLYAKQSVLIPRKGTLNNIMYIKKPFWCVDTMFYSILLHEYFGYFVFFYLKQFNFGALDQGSAVPSMTTEYLNNMKISLPESTILENFESTFSKLYQVHEVYLNEINKMKEFQSLLLSKMAKITN